MAGTQSDLKKRIKLTYLITDLKVGGVPLHLYRLATRLPRDRFAIRVISLADQGPVGDMLRQAGIAVHACGARSVRQVGALYELWRQLLAEPPDILHALLFHANMAARLLGPLAGISPRRILNEIQTVEIERPWHLLVDGLTCRLCRFEVGNSPSVIEHLHSFANIPWSRLHCEWGAVDVQAFATAAPLDRSALGIGSDESFLLWTGRLDPVKGFEEMLAAARRLKRAHRFKLFLCGEGAYRPVVEHLIRVNDLTNDVLLLGHRDDVPSLLRSADVFVFCSRTEGLPNSLLEAMAAGVAVVTTNVPGCRDVIQDGHTGLLVEPGSPEAIADGIDRLLSDPGLALRLGERAQKWVSEQADLESWVQRWALLYNDLL